MTGLAFLGLVMLIVMLGYIFFGLGRHVRHRRMTRRARAGTTL